MKYQIAPKGKRSSYMQWLENDIVPKVAFKILSPGNRAVEMVKKFKFYERYGVEEYYLYDPERIDLAGWQRIGKELEVIEQINGWISPRLNIRFDLSGEQLEIYFPNGQKFTNLKEVLKQLAEERQKTLQAEERANRLAARLRELGIEEDIGIS